ncbi:hypothetical protein GCM10009834_10330 [Streptomonospora arabica]
MQGRTPVRPRHPPPAPAPSRAPAAAESLHRSAQASVVWRAGQAGLWFSDTGAAGPAHPFPARFL